MRHALFEGPSALRDFLNPDNHPPLPLIELPECLNPFRTEGVHIFAKLMYLLPLLSIKSLPALNMLLEAEAGGHLKGVDTIVENSSGNTAFSLSVLATLFGVHEVTAMVPWDIAPGKLDLLRIAGAEPRLKKDGPDEPSGIEQARAMERGQSQSLRTVGGPAALDADGRQADSVCSRLGNYRDRGWRQPVFRGMAANVTIVGALCQPGSAVPGVRSEARLREILFDWRSSADAIVEVATKESFKRSVDLCRLGLMAGPSSGFALSGLLRFLQARQDASTLDALRNRDEEVWATFICADTPLPYLDKYSTHLDPGDF